MWLLNKYYSRRFEISANSVCSPPSTLSMSIGNLMTRQGLFPRNLLLFKNWFIPKRGEINKGVGIYYTNPSCTTLTGGLIYIVAAKSDICRANSHFDSTFTRLCLPPFKNQFLFSCGKKNCQSHVIKLAWWLHYEISENFVYTLGPNNYVEQRG